MKTEWKKVRLGDIATVTSSKRVFANQYTKTGIPFYRQKEIIEKNRGEALSEPLFISNDLYKKMEIDYGIPQKNDLLITGVGVTLGIPYLVKDETFYFKDGNLIWLKDISENVNSQFIFYYINSAEGQKTIWARTIGSAQPALTIDLVKQFQFPCPPLETQQKIAGILSAYDDLIENNRKQIKLLEEAAQKLYKEWFVKLNFPGHENVKIIDGVPEGWIYKKLDKVFNYVRGRSYSSDELSETKGTLFVNLKNIQAFGGYKRNAEKRYLGVYKPEQTISSGDIVLGVTDMTKERRLVGSVAQIPELGETATFTMDLIKLEPYEITKNFLYSSLRFGGISRQISPLANGVNVLHLKPEALNQVEMLIPDAKLIQHYDEFYEPIRLKIERVQKEIQLLQSARDKLLPRLMNGEMEI